MAEDSQELEHYEFSYSKTRPGLLPAWKARALEYWADPWNTYGTHDKNKFSWTWETLKWDPLGLVIGRHVLTENEIEVQIRQYEKREVSRLITANSNWDHMGSQMVSQKGSSILKYGYHPVGDDFNKEITLKKVEHSAYYTPVTIEGDGEKKFERRQINGMQYLLHKYTLGWYRWEPEKMYTGTVSGTILGGDGSCNHQPRPVKVNAGPNVRGEYARSLRHKDTPVYTYTNEGSPLDKGCGY